MVSWMTGQMFREVITVTHEKQSYYYKPADEDVSTNRQRATQRDIQHHTIMDSNIQTTQYTKLK